VGLSRETWGLPEGMWVLANSSEGKLFASRLMLWEGLRLPGRINEGAKNNSSMQVSRLGRKTKRIIIKNKKRSDVGRY